MVRALRANPDDAAVASALVKALAHPSAVVVTMAADLAGERELSALTPELVAALARLYENATEADPTCAGKIACATALDTLNYTDKAPFLHGAFFIQMQPAWGGPVDVATGLRVRCILALARFGGLDVLMVLAEALSDEHEAVRGAAAQSLAFCGEPAGAAMALQKIRAGDKDPAVTADALGALITLRPVDGLQRAGTLLQSRTPGLRPFVRLILGQSRLPDALPLLTRELTGLVNPAERREAFVAIGLLRTANSVAFLLDCVRGSPIADASAAIAALATQSQADAMRESIATAANGRNLDATIREAFA